MFHYVSLQCLSVNIIKPLKMDLWHKSRKMWATRQVNVLFNSKSIWNIQARQTINTVHIMYYICHKLQVQFWENNFTGAGDHCHSHNVSPCTHIKQLWVVQAAAREKQNHRKKIFALLRLVSFNMTTPSLNLDWQLCRPLSVEADQPDDMEGKPK